eukprot:CAMPEP_0185580760 /NCGR_PEP_ID=MMETSP0434-20130131/17719_1 /TAXON_ID=626734 ORGANISM="Favella taraikaensis, Strain Fe Narragansett Bay" /NCGR_SAMPLE_ID=MMETSP0434 /ASSEMBLY_ACC=CAM_ASM_000379 /LENGTH=43 /DNA_ID= /DNA_START= /DNA_END= /DNA_ORIENTATION=
MGGACVSGGNRESEQMKLKKGDLAAGKGKGNAGSTAAAPEQKR